MTIDPVLYEQQLLSIHKQGEPKPCPICKRTPGTTIMSGSLTNHKGMQDMVFGANQVVKCGHCGLMIINPTGAVETWNKIPRT